MTQRLFLLSASSTAATRAGRFPADEEVERPTDRLAFRRVDHLLSGPELRCRQTVAALDPVEGSGADVRADLADLDVGEWSGRDLMAVAESDPVGLQDWMTDPGARPHGGESLLDLVGRVGRFLSDLPDGRIAAVTSPWVLKAAIVHVLGAEPAGMFAVDIGPLEVLELTGRGAGWRMRALGPLAG